MIQLPLFDCERHITPISGKDSLSVAIVMMELEPDLPMEYVWHDTGWELPEVHKWIKRVERQLDITIHRCGDDLTEIIAEQGLLPSPMRRFCTKYSKIIPMRDWLGWARSCLYLGLRSDEDNRIQGLEPDRNQRFRFPLKEIGVDLSGAWKIVTEAELKPPTFQWQWMIDRVAELGGTRPTGMPPWEWESLFSGRSRPNCDNCIYMALYERIWLHETHPRLFERGVEIEQSTQHKSSFKWMRSGKPLDSIISRADEIKEKRANAIMKYLREWDGQATEQNPLSGVSCGLYCGK